MRIKQRYYLVKQLLQQGEKEDSFMLACDIEKALNEDYEGVKIFQVTASASEYVPIFVVYLSVALGMFFGYLVWGAGA